MRFCYEVMQTLMKSEDGAKFFRRHICDMLRIKFCEVSFVSGFASCNRNVMKYAG